MCQGGFHACFNPVDVLIYYNWGSDRYAEVLVEDFIEGDDKLVAKITIVREIPRKTFYEMCSGMKNSCGEIRWWNDYGLHRIDGPAVIYANGDRAWYFNGMLHREYEPAFIHENGDQEWWIDNKFIRGTGACMIDWTD